MHIPRWFLGIISACSTLFVATFVPWASWVTLTLVAISVRMENLPPLDRRLEEVSAALPEMERRLQRLEERGR